MQTTKNKLDTYTYNYNYAYACYTAFPAFCLLFMRLCIDSYIYKQKWFYIITTHLWIYFIYLSIHTYIHIHYIHIFAKSIIWNKAENKCIHKMESKKHPAKQFFQKFPLDMTVKNCQMESNLNRHGLQDCTKQAYRPPTIDFRILPI